MSNSIKKILLIINIVILFVVTGFSANKEESYKKLDSYFYLELTPVDPRSLLQGDYMTLNYDITDKASDFIYNNRAYIYDEKIAEPIGEVYYYLDNDIHSMGIVIQGKYRGKGYSYSALIELEKVAFEKNNISELSDIIPLDRIGAIKTFKKAGFKHTEFEQKKLVFGKESIARQLLIVKDDYFNNKINADNIIIRNEDRSE